MEVSCYHINLSYAGAYELAVVVHNLQLKDPVYNCCRLFPPRPVSLVPLSSRHTLIRAGCTCCRRRCRHCCCSSKTKPTEGRCTTSRVCQLERNRTSGHRVISDPGRSSTIHQQDGYCDVNDDVVLPYDWLTDGCSTTTSN